MGVDLVKVFFTREPKRCYMGVGQFGGNVYPPALTDNGVTAK
jgi:hypothetical protein